MSYDPACGLSWRISCVYWKRMCTHLLGTWRVLYICLLGKWASLKVTNFSGQAKGKWLSGKTHTCMTRTWVLFPAPQENENKNSSKIARRVGQKNLLNISKILMGENLKQEDSFLFKWRSLDYFPQLCSFLNQLSFLLYYKNSVISLDWQRLGSKGQWFQIGEYGFIEQTGKVVGSIKQLSPPPPPVTSFYAWNSQMVLPTPTPTHFINAKYGNIWVKVSSYFQV